MKTKHYKLGYAKTGMALAQASIIGGVGANLVSAVGGNPQTMAVYNSYLPMAAHAAGGGMIVKELKKLGKRRGY